MTASAARDTTATRRVDPARISTLAARVSVNRTNRRSVASYRNGRSDGRMEASLVWAALTAIGAGIGWGLWWVTSW